MEDSVRVAIDEGELLSVLYNMTGDVAATAAAKLRRGVNAGACGSRPR